MRGADVAPPHSRFSAPLRSTTRGLPTTRYGYEGSLCATVAVTLGRQAGALSGPAVTPKAQDKTIAPMPDKLRTLPRVYEYQYIPQRQRPKVFVDGGR
jgi:hypothetical protein